LRAQEYQIKYSDFNGPANLLLDLVRKRRIDIYQIKLSAVISDFINHIKANIGTLLDTLSSFLYIACILLEIKSSSIIPSQSKVVENEIEIIDRSMLLEREKEYRVYQKISNYLEKLIEVEKLYYIRESPIEKEFIDLLPDFLDNLNVEHLNYLASFLLKKSDFIIDIYNIYIDNSTTTISDEINRVKKLLFDKSEITFRELSEKYELLIDKIICFLSILELYKSEEIDIVQFENFGSIIIKKVIKA
jgi:segregation and condensation protein A